MFLWVKYNTVIWGDMRVFIWLLMMILVKGLLFRAKVQSRETRNSRGSKHWNVESEKPDCSSKAVAAADLGMN